MDIYRTPHLRMFETHGLKGLSLLHGRWYVSREPFKVNGRTPVQYLRADGTWHSSMALKEGHPAGGTYFKTLEEVIAVLAEFEINVQGVES